MTPMPSKRDKVSGIRFSLRYILMCSAFVPLTFWALVREHWFVFWCSLGVLLFCTYLALPMQHDHAKRWRFGPRDVLFWLIVITLGQAWWADHRRLTHLTNEQRQLSDDNIEKWLDLSERRNRFIDLIRPPSIHRCDELYAEKKCDRCGVRVGDKLPDDLWYGWQLRNDDDQPRKTKSLCNECAADFGVMGQDQTLRTLEKKWSTQVDNIDSAAPPRLLNQRTKIESSLFFSLRTDPSW